jgi:hypothetical protein
MNLPALKGEILNPTANKSTGYAGENGRTVLSKFWEGLKFSPPSRGLPQATGYAGGLRLSQKVRMALTILMFLVSIIALVNIFAFLGNYGFLTPNDKNALVMCNMALNFFKKLCKE